MPVLSAEIEQPHNARRINTPPTPVQALAVSLLTGGQDKPYALGLSTALAAQGIDVEFIGSDELDCPELRENPRIRFLNLRGNQRSGVNIFRKAARLLLFYLRLLRYAAGAQPKTFHILWNERLVLFDRTLLMLFYRFVGRHVVFTAHNVNAGKRDGRDTLLNRLSLRIQYRLVHHIFVHTEKMKAELEADFQVPRGKVTVIPLGLNETVPVTRLTAAEAKEKLGIAPGQKTILFFGRITPYKGLDYLIEAMSQLVTQDPACRLIVAGEIKHSNAYWPQLQELIEKKAVRPWLVERIQFIPDEETELYFKAADVLALPYTDVFQSGVLILGYSFGLPVIATDVGSLREDVIEGKTGFVCRPRDATDLARAIRGYFDSELFQRQEATRDHIRAYAKNRFSWSAVAATTERVYAGLINK